MTTSYWFIRHGPTHAKGFCGHLDLPADLSDRAQISRLRAVLPQDALMLSSDLSRARETARALWNGQQRLPDAPEFREMDFGDWDGQDFQTVERQDPALWRAFWHNPGKVAPPNGESFDQLCARVQVGLEQFHGKGLRGNIIIVAHFATILAALKQATGMTTTAAFTFKINNFSVTRLDFLHKSNNWRVMGVNVVV